MSVILRQLVDAVFGSLCGLLQQLIGLLARCAHVDNHMVSFGLLQHFQRQIGIDTIRGKIRKIVTLIRDDVLEPRQILFQRRRVIPVFCLNMLIGLDL